MKTTTLIAAVAFVATHAAAVPEAAADAHGRSGFCDVPGQFCQRADHTVSSEEAAACGVPGRPCNTIKHVAHGISDILLEADKQGSTYAPYCSIEGEACDAAKAHLGNIAEKTRSAYATVYAREADAIAEANPHPFYVKRKGRIGYCGVPGEFCWKKRDGTTNYDHIGCEPGQFCPHGQPEHDPEAHAALRGRLGVAGEPGTPWLVSRDAAPSPFYVKKKGRIGYCGVSGEFCWKKRGLENSNLEGVCGAEGHVRTISMASRPM